MLPTKWENLEKKRKFLANQRIKQIRELENLRFIDYLGFSMLFESSLWDISRIRMGSEAAPSYMSGCPYHVRNTHYAMLNTNKERRLTEIFLEYCRHLLRWFV